MPGDARAGASFLPLSVLRDVFSGSSDGFARRCVHAAFLFVDVSGFTSLGEALSRTPGGDEALARHLNSYLGQMLRTIGSHGGQIWRFVGDALFALWPCDVPGGEDGTARTAADAVRLAGQAALELQTALHAARLDEGVQLSTKVGIGLGPLSMSILGGSLGTPYHYLATGAACSDAFASQQAATGSGQTWMSRAAWLALHPPSPASGAASQPARPSLMAKILVPNAALFGSRRRLSGIRMPQPPPAAAIAPAVASRSALAFTVHLLSARGGGGACGKGGARPLSVAVEARLPHLPPGIAHVCISLNGVGTCLRPLAKAKVKDAAFAQKRRPDAVAPRTGSHVSGTATLLRTQSFVASFFGAPSASLGASFRGASSLLFRTLPVAQHLPDRSEPAESATAGDARGLPCRLSSLLPVQLNSWIAAGDSSPSWLRLEHAASHVRDVAVLFFDLGIPDSLLLSTTRAEGEGLASTRALHDAVQAAQAAVQHYGGAVNKCVSDDKGLVLLAVFGGPGGGGALSPIGEFQTSAHPAASAALAAIALVDAAHRAGYVGAAAGVTLGSVYCGLVGGAAQTTQLSMEWSVLGDTVNVSARLMGKAVAAVRVAAPEWPGQPMAVPVLLDGAAAAFAALSGLRLVELPAVQLKGKEASVRVFTLENPPPTALLPPPAHPASTRRRAAFAPSATFSTPFTLEVVEEEEEEEEEEEDAERQLARSRTGMLTATAMGVLSSQLASVAAAAQARHATGWEAVQTALAARQIARPKPVLALDGAPLVAGGNGGPTQRPSTAPRGRHLPGAADDLLRAIWHTSGLGAGAYLPETRSSRARAREQQGWLAQAFFLLGLRPSLRWSHAVHVRARPDSNSASPAAPSFPLAAPTVLCGAQSSGSDGSCAADHAHSSGSSERRTRAGRRATFAWWSTHAAARALAPTESGKACALTLEALSGAVLRCDSAVISQREAPLDPSSNALASVTALVAHLHPLDGGRSELSPAVTSFLRQLAGGDSAAAEEILCALASGGHLEHVLLHPPEGLVSSTSSSTATSASADAAHRSVEGRGVPTLSVRWRNAAWEDLASLGAAGGPWLSLATQLRLPTCEARWGAALDSLHPVAQLAARTLAALTVADLRQAGEHRGALSAFALSAFSLASLLPILPCLGLTSPLGADDPALERAVAAHLVAAEAAGLVLCGYGFPPTSTRAGESLGSRVVRIVGWPQLLLLLGRTLCEQVSAVQKRIAARPLKAVTPSVGATLPASSTSSPLHAGWLLVRRSVGRVGSSLIPFALAVPVWKIRYGQVVALAPEGEGPRPLALLLYIAPPSDVASPPREALLLSHPRLPPSSLLPRGGASPLLLLRVHAYWKRGTVCHATRDVILVPVASRQQPVSAPRATAAWEAALSPTPAAWSPASRPSKASPSSTVRLLPPSSRFSPLAALRHPWPANSLEQLQPDGVGVQLVRIEHQSGSATTSGPFDRLEVELVTLRLTTSLVQLPGHALPDHAFVLARGETLTVRVWRRHAEFDAGIVVRQSLGECAVSAHDCKQLLASAGGAAVEMRLSLQETSGSRWLPTHSRIRALLPRPLPTSRPAPEGSGSLVLRLGASRRALAVAPLGQQALAASALLRSLRRSVH